MLSDESITDVIGNPMFKVVFHKTIWDGNTPQTSRNMALFQRVESIPFTPSPTIEIFWGREPPQAPKRVTWNVDRQSFTCAMNDEFPHEIGSDKYDFEWLIDNALQSGWQPILKKNI